MSQPLKAILARHITLLAHGAIQETRRCCGARVESASTVIVSLLCAQGSVLSIDPSEIAAEETYWENALRISQDSIGTAENSPVLAAEERLSGQQPML